MIDLELGREAEFKPWVSPYGKGDFKFRFLFNRWEAFDSNGGQIDVDFRCSRKAALHVRK
jgi:hypothetical protein